MKTLIAKYPGKCFECGQPFEKGTPIKYYGRLHCEHVVCPRNERTEPEYHACWNCKDPKGIMRNYGAAAPVYCDACEARIRPNTLNYKLRHQDNSSHEDRECGDLAYEDRCAEACGLGL